MQSLMKQPLKRTRSFLSCAGTEVIADFPAPWTINEEALVIPVGDEMKHVRELIFLRHEPQPCAPADRPRKAVAVG